MKKLTGVCLSIIFLLNIWPAAAEEIKIGAGAAPTENVLKKIKEPMEKDIGLKMAVIDNGPYEALVALDRGEVDAAAGGMSFRDWMKLMEERKYPIADKHAYRSAVIGKDLIKVIVNKSTPIERLDPGQLKGIFTGEYTNWKEVGGPDKPIIVVYGSKIPGTQNVFRKQIMDDENYVSKMLEATNAPDVKDKVKSNPGAVGLAPVTLVDDSVHVPAIAEIGRPIVLITKGYPSVPVAKMIAYIEEGGKKYILNK
jgi:phosphate transport system substrate-binding protein